MNAHHSKAFLRKPLVNSDISLRQHLVANVQKMDEQLKQLEQKLFDAAGPDIQEMIDAGENIETCCQFCNSKYVFTPDELKEMM